MKWISRAIVPLKSQIGDFHVCTDTSFLALFISLKQFQTNMNVENLLIKPF